MQQSRVTGGTVNTPQQPSLQIEGTDSATADLSRPRPVQPPSPATPSMSYVSPRTPPSAPPLPQATTSQDHPQVRSHLSTSGLDYPPVPAGPSRIPYNQPQGIPAGHSGPQYSQHQHNSWQFS